MTIEAGADAFGMIFAPSPRRIAWEEAERIAERIPESITPVGVFVDPSRDEIERVRALFPTMLVQLSGHEPPAFATSVGGTVIKAIHIAPDASVERIQRLCNRYANALAMFDTHVDGMRGGTGVPFEWKRIASIARWRPVMVAGGLTPENVRACVRTVRPFGVDVRTGVETDDKKDVNKVRAFVRAVRESDAA
jgi:phosphoribosylanthranilate isomerase